MTSSPGEAAASAGALTGVLGGFGLEGLRVSSILRLALRNGGDLAELFFEDTVSTRVTYEGGRLDRVVDGRDRGVGLRVVFEGRSVYGFTTEPAEEALLSLARALSAAVGGRRGGRAKRKTERAWAVARQPSMEIDRYRPLQSPRDATLVEKIALARRAEQAARRKLPGARQVSAVLVDSLRRTLVLNSDGLIAPDRRTLLQLYVQVVGQEDGRLESAHESDGGHVGLEFFEQVPPEAIGTEAARRVRLLLAAKPAPAGTMPVVISSEAGGTMIHEAVGHGLEADLACNGLSVYEGKLGQQVASPRVSVLDDGTIPGRRGSSRLDDEGNPTRRTLLIENGVLRSYLVDRVSGMKFDLMPTGNGRRESFRHKPIVRMTNTFIAPGTDDPERILAETPYGLYVRKMGGGQVNTVTGDFVFAVTEGYLIENGTRGVPIRGATLVGNGPRVLMTVDRVGSDLGFSTGTCGKDGQAAPVTDAQPTIRIPELTVGGEVPLASYWPGK
jgi:TldD protein